jgi:regulator of sigma E protease
VPPQIYVVLALIVLVVLHELGHFLAAKAVGIRATKFYVFFPPALFKRKVGDVEYGIGAIPAGGFVKLPGMFEPVPAEVAERLRWEFEDVEPLLADGSAKLRLDAARRVIANAASPDEISEPLRDVLELLDGIEHDEDRTDEQRKIVRRAGERVRNLLDDAHPKAYWRAALWRRMTVIFAGPFVNLLIAFVVLTGFIWLYSPYTIASGPLHVVGVDKNSPAQEAGLVKGSRITGWNGSFIGRSNDELGERVRESRGKPIELTWKTPDGDTHTETIEPARIGAEKAKRLGINLEQPESSVEVHHEVTSFGNGVELAWLNMERITVDSLTRLPRVLFDPKVREEVGSVVGIVDFADEVDAAGLIVHYVAVISLILAVMNLLPLLPLDGGHLLFGLLEAIRRGRPMPRAAFERYSLIGMALVLMLFMIGLDNDIDRIRG